MSIKNPTLRRRTKELTECANDARECQLLGYELKELGSLVARMAIHMGDLQRKIDSQAEHIKDLNEKLADRKTENSSEKPNNCEPQTYITENRDTQILDAWQVHNGNTTSVKDEPQTDCAWK